jgi:tetratricopeptide (TPR) repeat protein
VSRCLIGVKDTTIDSAATAVYRRPVAKKPAARPDPPLSRAALLPLALLLVFGLQFGLGLAFGWAVVASTPLVVLFISSPVWVRRSAEAFDRDAVALLASGRAADLPGRYRQALGLRLFGPKAFRAARRAMVAAETGDLEGARTEFARASDGWEDPKNVPFAVRVGYAHACYATRDYPEAVVAYRKVLEERVALPRMRKNLAHALIEEGDGLRDALEVLDRADKEASDPDEKKELALLRAWALHAMGQKKKAKRLFKANADVDTELAARAREACGLD